MEKVDLSDFFKTKAEAIDFSSRISEIVGKVFETNFNFDQVASEKLGIEKKDKLTELMRNHSINTQSHDQVKTFLNGIIQKIATIPVLNLIIAVEPNNSLLSNISSWCIFNIGKQVLFDIKIDKNLIGGAELYYNGKHGNYSIKDSFNRVITEILNKPALASHIQDPQAHSTQAVPKLIN